MLAKCANSVCLEEFRSLRRGRLFVMDVATPQSTDQLGMQSARGQPRLEYFWLCDSCRKTMTIVVDKDYQVGVTSTLCLQAMTPQPIRRPNHLVGSSNVASEDQLDKETVSGRPVTRFAVLRQEWKT